MEDTMQNNEEGLSLLEIIRILLIKIKLLVVIVLIGAIGGGFFGFLKSKDVNYYGTSIEFYVNPEQPKDLSTSANVMANAVGSQYGVYGAYGRHVMDAITKLLSSESFTEMLMLEDNNLPSKEIYPNLDATKYANAEAAQKRASDAWEVAAKLDKPRSVALENLQAAWIRAGQTSTFTEAAYHKLINNSKEGTYDYLEDAYDEFTVIDEQRETALLNASEIQQDSTAIIEILLEEWRNHEYYLDVLEFFKESITYSYLGSDDDVKDANNLARSFIYVDISVLNDEVVAKDLLERVKRTVPSYIEQNMIVPSGYEGTTCTRITRNDSIEYLNPNYKRNQTIIYGLLAACIAGAITALLIILFNTQDQRLRDYEIITKKLNVPVLGIIPTINEISQPEEEKKENEGGK